jgi:hypothetical protein
MCRRPVAAGTPVIVEHGETIHPDCHLGLMDAGAAVARLLRERPGEPLCAPCIATALGLTFTEAQAGSARLRPLRGFVTRFETCLGCGKRRQVVRALRGPGPSGVAGLARAQ